MAASDRRYHRAVTETPIAAAPLIHARGLTKCFGSFTAVDGIDFDVAPGEAFGFLGPNGAGKTSTMRMIGCTSPVTGGTLSVLGLDPNHDCARIRSRLGLPEACGLEDLARALRARLYSLLNEDDLVIEEGRMIYTMKTCRAPGN